MRGGQLARHLSGVFQSSRGRILDGFCKPHPSCKTPFRAVADANPVFSHALIWHGARKLERPRLYASTAGDELPAKEDRYQGMIIQQQQLPQDPAEFASKLDYSLQEWRRRGKRGIWLKLSTAQSVLIPPAIAAGFEFRHAERGSVSLTQWLPDTLDLLPEGPTHQVGVGAFVVNSKQEMLLVQERHGLLDGKKFWKMPTGLTNLGEDITAAAEREVLEETGIRAAFHRVLSVRQSHGHNFGRSDLFFVCAMRLESEGQEIVLQQDEVEAAAWHPLHQVEHFPVFAGPVLSTMFASCKAYADGRFAGISADKLANGFNTDSSLVLHA